MPAAAPDVSLAFLRRCRASEASAINLNPNPNPATGDLSAVLLENRAALLRFLLARRIAPDDAEDILQDLFVKLKAHAPGSVAEPRAYLFRMADNLVLDRRRSAGRRCDREEAWVTAQSGGPLGVDERPSAERTLIAREKLVAVTAALAGLPDRTIAIFRRFRIDGAPQKEIAAEFGISLSAVEKHLQKAYQVVIDAKARMDADSSSSDRHGEVREP